MTVSAASAGATGRSCGACKRARAHFPGGFRPGIEPDLNVCLAGEGGVKATGDGEVEIEKFDQEDDLDHVKVSGRGQIAPFLGRFQGTAASRGCDSCLPLSPQITVKAASDKRADAGLGRQMKMIGEPLIREALKTFVGELRVH